MRNLHSYIWAVFVMLFIFMLGQGIYIDLIHHKSFYLFGIETANAADGAQTLNAWFNDGINGRSLLYFAQLNTWMDFLFIIGYTGVLIMVSYALMQKQKNVTLNNWLRTCLLLAVFAGLFDVIEDIILLCDMHHYYPGKHFISSMYVAYPKWILIVVIVVSWIISLFKSS